MSARARWLAAVVVSACMTAGVGNLSAGTYWVAANAEVDEVVADSTTIPPRHPSVVALSTPIPFHNFRYPHVNPAEDVTFIADDSHQARARPQHGIYRSFGATHELKPLVVNGLPVQPNSAVRFAFMTGVQVDRNGDLAFTARLSNGDWGVFHWATNGTFRTVATAARLSRLEDYGRYPSPLAEAELTPERHTVLPGGRLPLRSVGYCDIRAGRVLYQARDASGTALVCYDLNARTQRVLLRTGMSVPGREGARFEFIPPQNWITEDSVIFRAARVSRPYHLQAKPWHWFEDFPKFIAQRPAHEPAKISDEYGMYGWFDIDWNDPRAFDLNNLVTLADWTTPVSSENGGTFTYFGGSAVAGRLVAFLAETHRAGRDSVGIYYTVARRKGEAGPPVFRNIVDTDTQIESLFKGPFTGFRKWVQVLDDSVLFTGYAEGGKHYAGVFLYKPALDALFLLCDNRQPIDGKAVRDFELAPNHSLIRGRFAVAIQFQDGSAGVYLATIPPNSFKRMSTGQ